MNPITGTGLHFAHSKVLLSNWLDASHQFNLGRNILKPNVVCSIFEAALSSRLHDKYQVFMEGHEKSVLYL